MPGAFYSCRESLAAAAVAAEVWGGMRGSGVKCGLLVDIQTDSAEIDCDLSLSEYDARVIALR